MLKAALQKVKKIIYPVTYVIENFDNLPKDLLWPVHETLQQEFQQTNSLLSNVRNLQMLEKNEFLQDHLRALREARDTELPGVSYGLKNAARQLHVSCHRQRTQKTTAICTVALGDGYRRSVDYCLQSQARYAEKAGADYVMLDLMPANPDRHVSWYKIPLIFRLLQEGYDRVLYIDADAMVTNDEVPLDNLFAPLAGRRESFLIAEDEGGLNLGVFLIQRNPAAYRMLDLIWIHHLGHVPNWEQQAFSFLINWYQPIPDYVLIAPDPKAFNSFPYEREHVYRVIQENNWTPGDFICHFSGIRRPLLEKMISYYVHEYDLGRGLVLHEADSPPK